MSDVFNIPTVVQFVTAHVEKRQSVIKKKTFYLHETLHCNNYTITDLSTEMNKDVTLQNKLPRSGPRARRADSVHFTRFMKTLKGAQTGFIFNKLQSK